MDTVRDAPIGSAFRLTAEQDSVVTLGSAERVLVTAGAGTGKTAVLIARLTHLVGRCGLSPGRGILVLTFTRSAVGVLRGRLATAGGDVQYVRVATFDSFATRVLSEFKRESGWTSEDYDGRIRSATDLIKEDEEAAGMILGYEHVLIDEIQDLVGDRANLVKAILAPGGGGFTLFGDPAQGIYNFQMEGEARALGSQLFYRWLEDTWGGSLIQKTLTSNFRATSDATRSVLWAGEQLCAREPDYDAIQFKLQSQMLSMPDAQPLRLAARAFVRGGESTAILCRTNGQALLVSRDLFEANIPHDLQRSSTEAAVAPWISRIFNNAPHPQMSKQMFLQRAEELAALGVEIPESKVAWRLIKRVDRRSQDDVRLEVIATSVRTGAIPDDLKAGLEGTLTVSTIHRAKGLEFERVVLVDCRDEYADDGLTTAEDTRVLYVGVTRCRKELLRTACPSTKGMSSKQNPGQRWVSGPTPWMTLGFEVRGTDLHSSDPAGGFMVVGAPVIETQEYIATSVEAGDALEAEIVKRSSSGSERAFYAVKHRSRVVGVTSEEFGNLLFQTLKSRRRGRVTWPTHLDGLRVEGLDTVAGTATTSQKAGLGVSGMWLRVRPFGLAQLRYPKSG